jgi:hypothetical protein
MAPMRPDLPLQICYKGCLKQCPLPRVGRNGPGDDVRVGGLGEARVRVPTLNGAHVQGAGEG